MRRLLKLHPHEHTGKLLQHRHTSYRALAVILVLAAGFMVFLNHLATVAADSQIVTATVPAPIPIGKPAITSPLQGSDFARSDVSIAGTCPIITPQVLIVIYRDNVALGSQPCSTFGTFAVPVTLRTGEQQLIARVMTITDDFGESSDLLTISYSPPVDIPANDSSAQKMSSSGNKPLNILNDGPETASPDLQIHSDSPFLVFSPTKKATWQGSFEGGVPPYKVRFIWGDGDIDWFRNVRLDTQTISHQYATGQPAYRIKITLVDSQGTSLNMYLTAVSLITPTANSKPNGSGGNSLGAAVYAAYVVTLLLLLGLWGFEHGKNITWLPWSQAQPVSGNLPAMAKQRRLHKK